MSIIVYNKKDNILLYKITDPMYVVYELIYNKSTENIICLCEFNILAFDNEGKLLWQCGMQEPIYDYQIKGINIEIQFEDKSMLNLSLESGTVNPA